MSYSKVPTDTFPGYSSDGTNITIPLAALPGLTSAEAHTSTGDARKIVKAILDKALAVQNAAEAADQSARMVLSKAPSLLDENTVQHGYSANFQIDISGGDVKAE